LVEDRATLWLCAKDARVPPKNNVLSLGSFSPPAVPADAKNNVLSLGEFSPPSVETAEAARARP
jgi:hypothetical protein